MESRGGAQGSDIGACALGLAARQGGGRWEGRVVKAGGGLSWGGGRGAAGGLDLPILSTGRLSPCKGFGFPEVPAISGLLEESATFTYFCRWPLLTRGSYRVSTCSGSFSQQRPNPFEIKIAPISQIKRYKH